MSGRSLLVTFVALVAAGAIPACGWLVATTFRQLSGVGRVSGGAVADPAHVPGRPSTPERRPAVGVIINGSGVPRSSGLTAAGADPWVERNRQVRRRDAVAGGGRGYLL